MILSQIGRGIGEFLFLLIILAIVAVIISKKSSTAGVIQSAGSLFSSIVAVIVAPVKGKSL